MNGFLISGTILHGKRICLGATLFSSLVFVTAVPGFAQDLGALAREAQARKDAQPFHINHVYTNEDLQRPQILLPEDQHAAASAPKPLLPETPPEMPVLEVNAPEVSLGEIARKYQKAKLAMKPPRVPRPAVTAHVYSNDDLVRDKILTPKDTEFYKAALERPVAPAVVAPQREAQAAETVAASEVSLGDLARAAYQQARQELQAKATTLPFRHDWSSMASNTTHRHTRHSEHKDVQVAHFKAHNQAGDHSSDGKTAGVEIVTVQPGDSLWKLARKHLGHGVEWRALLKANPEIEDPTRLKIGSSLRVEV